MVRKTVWLSADTDCVAVDQEVENPTRESRSVAPYLQHNLVVNGARYSDNWYLPASRGVLVNVQPDREGGRAIGPDWVLDPTAGWMAVLDRATRRGLLFAFDYNYIEKIYTCGQTAEWFLATVPVGPGKTFKTSYVIKPLKTFEDVAYGSARVAADLRAQERGRSVRVDHDLAAVSGGLKDVTVSLRAVGWRSKRELATESYTLPALGFERVRHSFTFRPDALKDGVVIQATVRAGGGEDRYEYFYAGDQDAHERRYNYFATKGGALAGAKGDAYSLKPPRKVKTFEKPDFAKIARPAAGRFRCLVVFGLYTQMLNLDDALAPWRPGGRQAPEFTWANCPPNAVETFPGSYDELFGYNLVVLGDVNAKALGDIGFEMLCDYVAQGGALLVTGGPYAFGNGEFEGLRFLDVLPVKLAGPFDLKWAGKGQSWPLAPAAAGAAVLSGVAFADTPRVYWRHVTTPKPDATAVLTAGGQPALVLGRYGQGRVAVLTLSPTGEGAAGETPWWAWAGWPPLLRNLAAWLTEGPR